MKWKGSKGESCDDSTYLAHVQSSNHRLRNRHLIPCTLSSKQGNSINCYFLLDTGAMQDNFITEDMAEQLETLGIHSCVCNKIVCSAFTGICRRSKGCIEFSLGFFNEITDSIENIFVSAVIADIVVDVIIGLPTIIYHNMLAKLMSRFSENSLEEGGLVRPVDSLTPASLADAISLGGAFARVPTRGMADPLSLMQVDGGESSSSLGAPGDVTKSLVTTALMKLHVLHRKPMTAFIDPVQDDDEIEELSPTIDPWDENHLPRSGRDNLQSIHVEGSDTLKRGIGDLLSEFEDVFSTELKREPAKIPPMELTVNRELWERSVNSRAPRVVSILKQLELRKQINKMLDCNVIQPSEAAYYSQVLLTPKTDGSWRFCVDFRNLNAACANIGGYIPMIKEMLQRLGKARPKIFGVLDLTKGYYQAPLSLLSVLLTAFITFMGLFQWLRVPMGLKGAPTYFQRVMVQVVLVGLVMYICEVYLDDIIVHARTEIEFLERLRAVFERLRKHGITLNPAKCRLGMDKTEYVGHVIDETGLSFSQEKKNEVLRCSRPHTQKDLKKFLGLVNYFRDHIQNHSMIVQPLHEMVPGGELYKRQAVLKWTPETIEAFNTIQKEVVNCPKLFFINEALPITLATDASDYGIGAYLYQTTHEDEEQPLAFISKKLAGAQLNWSTPEKECYAIFYAVKKLEYLIRDVKFTLYTDHKNLTYINEGGSPKVVRWKVAIQEFMFDIVYLEGEKNLVADHWSRTVPKSQFVNPELDDVEKTKLPPPDPEDETTSLLMNLIGDSFRIPDKIFQRISAVHNSVVGHMGVENTLQRIYRDQKGAPEPLMRAYIRQFIRQCACCQKMSRVKYQRLPRVYFFLLIAISEFSWD